MLTLGDVYEIKTEKGYAYFQYANDYEFAGDQVIRIYQGFFKMPIESVNELAGRPKKQILIYTLKREGLKYKDVRKVGHIPLIEEEKKFPLLIDDSWVEMGGPWSIFDGKKYVRIGRTLTEEQKKIPPTGILNTIALKLMLIGKWKHFRDDEHNQIYLKSIS